MSDYMREYEAEKAERARLREEYRARRLARADRVNSLAEKIDRRNEVARTMVVVCVALMVLAWIRVVVS